MTTRLRKPSSVRRREIAGAVLRIIGEKGLPAVTTRALAEEVGVSSGALFRHFASLEDVYRECVREGIARMEKTFPDASLPPLVRLFTLARNRIHLLGSDAGLAWLLRSEQAYLVLPADSVEELRALVRRSRTFLLAALRAGMGDGTIRADLAPEVLLVCVMGTIHACIGMAGVHREAAKGPGVESVLEGLRRLLAAQESPSKPTTKRKRSKR